MMHIRPQRGRATVDAFIVPGTPPFDEPPDTTAIYRYEEDSPAMRYNGVAYDEAARSWAFSSNSGLYFAYSQTENDTTSLPFTGRWVGVGFLGNTNGGLADPPFSPPMLGGKKGGRATSRDN